MKRIFSPILFSVLLTYTLSGFALEAVQTKPLTKEPLNTKTSLPLEDLQRFTSVVEQIRNYYVQPTTDKALFENAIRGMLSGLDPHSAYLDPEEFAELKAATSGKFGGLGIEVTLEEGFIRVISPIDDTPATRAGVLAGDLIVKLDDTPVKGLTLKKAVELMRGNPGTHIVLTILRKGQNNPLKLKVDREIIRSKSIKKEVLASNYGYIKISQFQNRTAEDMIQAVNDLKKETNQNLKGLILDLRNNPGGILDSSVKVSDAFLDPAKLKYEGMIVYTEGRLPGSKIREVATGSDILNNAPIVILINGGSASASEIVAGALQDQKRAVVVGTQSFGKGSVQTVLPLKDNYGLKLTTALYYTPSGRSIQATGIVPDIEIKDVKIPETKKDVDDLSWAILKESDLTGHLSANKEQNKNNKTEKNNQKMPSIPLLNTPSDTQRKAGVTPVPVTPDAPLIVRDYQLNEALNILKGLAMLKNK